MIVLENDQISCNVHSDQWKLLFQDVKMNTMNLEAIEESISLITFQKFTFSMK